jgi:putative SOS response-associated peptidase YedK
MPRTGPFAFAGPWERWSRGADADAIDSFAIVTTAANPRIRLLHDRMSVILAPQAVDT